MYVIRGNRQYTYSSDKEDIDPTWTSEDKARALTVAARLASKGVEADELDRLIRCIVWKSKFPGLIYEDVIEQRIQSLTAGL
jgi:hypothetical protein